MKIAIGADHGAYQHKEVLKKWLEENNYEVIDFGAFSEQSSDYPDFAYPTAKAVAKNEADLGIVMCGTGIGASIVANKVNGIRCALIQDPKIAKITREHNNSNVLAMGARVIDQETMLEVAKAWLETAFSGEERHCVRIDKIKEIEKEVCDER